MIDDIRKASDDQVSFREAIAEVCRIPLILFKNRSLRHLQALQMKYTVGPEIYLDPYHVAAVRTPLTRNLAVCFPDVQDEITCAFADYVPAEKGECKLDHLHLPVHAENL